MVAKRGKYEKRVIRINQKYEDFCAISIEQKIAMHEERVSLWCDIHFRGGHRTYKTCDKVGGGRALSSNVLRIVVYLDGVIIILCKKQVEVSEKCKYLEFLRTKTSIHGGSHDFV